MIPPWPPWSTMGCIGILRIVLFYSNNTIRSFLPISCFYKHIKAYYINYFVLERYTSKTDISAGETPEIREACPIEIGLYASSF